MAADLVLSRAGAMTISELNACGRPAVLIPYRHAAHNHQYLNAQYQVEQNSALMIEEKELDAGKLTAIILELYGDRAKLSEMAENSLRLGRRQAAPFIMTEMNRIVSELRESGL